MKLNQNQIQFIDGYLHRNDVIYVDIRAEMIDHIATGVEEKMKDEDIDFHDAFVSYVNSNHKEIFSMNKNIWRFALPEIKNYLIYFFKPTSLFLVVFIIALYTFLNKNGYQNFVKETLPMYVLGSIVVVSFLSFIYFGIIKKQQYFFVEKNGIVFLILYWIDLFFLKPFQKSERLSDGLTVVFMCLFTVYIFYTINQLKKFFKTKMIKN
ncbi:hypothetical protein [Flavobacterium sp.]|jgi:hypothetical protein|uniref:hypothetical protein n=1 Tax=Flavobacterium sp. TaxID=239 RepID=UPI0022C5F08E|nr:hypothetical protein [Flavobacterium sp.]MCZ8089254.1 hypothetical protein [Flavobacterium sp.]